MDAFKWWAEALTGLPPRVVYKRVEKPSYVLYTDASFENNRGHIAAVLFDIENNTPGKARKIDTILSSPASEEMIGLFRNTSTIFGLELTAVVMAIFQFRLRFTGKSIVVYVDNNAVLGALVKGQTAGNPAHAFISGMWMAAATLSMTIWFERVPSATNVADLPTRGRTPGYEYGSILPFFPLKEWLDYTHRAFPPLFYNAEKIPQSKPFQWTKKRKMTRGERNNMTPRTLYGP